MFRPFDVPPHPVQAVRHSRQHARVASERLHIEITRGPACHALGPSGRRLASRGPSSANFSRISSSTSSPIAPSRSTHVSLLPPPCDELTTSDPLRNATRVSPPGTSVTFSPIKI